MMQRFNCSYAILYLMLHLQLNNVDNVRKQLEVQTDDLRQTIEDKLRSAEENRTENMGKMLEKLKEHVSIKHSTFSSSKFNVRRCHISHIKLNKCMI